MALSSSTTLLANRTRADQRRIIGTTLVVAQFVLIGLCVVPLGPVLFEPFLVVGLALIGVALALGLVAAFGLGRDLRAHPVPRESGMLHTHGIYAFVRHPMYAAVLLGSLGVTLATGRLVALLGLVGLAVLLHVKARFEDQLLMAKFGWQFAVYAGRVPAMVPAPWRSHRR